MNTIAPGGTTPLPLPPSLDFGAAAAALAARTGTLPPVPDWVKQIIGGTQTHPDGDTVTHANGSPRLEPPQADFSGDQLALVLAAVDMKIKDGQMRVAKQGIEALQSQKASANKDMLAKLADAAKHQASAQTQNKVLKVLGWIGLVAAVAGSVAAVAAAVAVAVVTAGTGAELVPLAIAGAMVVIAGATAIAVGFDLASQINQAVHPDAPPFSMGSVLGDLLDKVMNLDGMPPFERVAVLGAASLLGFLLMQPDMAGALAEKAALVAGANPDLASKIHLGFQIACTITSVIGMVALTALSFGTAGAASAAEGVNDVLDIAETTGKTVSTVTRVAGGVVKGTGFAQAVDSLVGGGLSVTDGGLKISVGVQQDLAAHDNADAKEAKARIAAMQGMTDDLTEHLKQLMQSLDEAMSRFSAMVSAAGDQRANIARSFVPG